MKKTRDFVPTPTLINKVTALPVGGGFIIYHVENGLCQVAPFVMDRETGQVLQPNGQPLRFVLEPEQDSEVEYEIVVKRRRNKRQSYEVKPI
jgi:hypothetical protein